MRTAKTVTTLAQQDKARIQQAFNEGWAASVAGKDWSENPHPADWLVKANLEFRSAWASGFNAAPALYS